MSLNTSTTFNALAIRDTDTHNGSTIYNGELIVKTLIIENSLNQTVTLQCQGSAHSDFSNSFNIGSPFDITASTNQPQTCDAYYPYWRLTAVCDTAPTSGTLTAHVYGVSD